MKKVKDVVRISGLSKRSLQYYDEIGLMKTKRSPLNYRLYSEDDLDRLWTILVYKEMGFHLAGIKMLLEADEKKKNRFLEREMNEISDRIDDFERKKRYIKKIIENGVPDRIMVCKGDDSTTYRELVRLLAERF